MEIGKEYIVSAKFPNGAFFRINANTNFDSKNVVYLGKETNGVGAHKFWHKDSNKVIRVNPRVVIEYIEYDSGFARPQALLDLLNQAAGDPTPLEGGKRHTRAHKTRKVHGRKHKGKKHKGKKHTRKTK